MHAPRAANMVQMPFPSTRQPCQELSDYYIEYERQFTKRIPAYYIPEGELWEAPIWVSHLTALLDASDVASHFIDLSKEHCEAQACFEYINQRTRPGDFVLFSPLAQNLTLTSEVSQLLLKAGRYTIIGGNMSPLVERASATHIHHGQLTRQDVRQLFDTTHATGETVRPRTPGLQADITWSPNHRHLANYRGQVPMLRINASHGCLYKCSFCGDAWSNQLTNVASDALEREIDDLIEKFPETKVIYIGDKTFGQSPAAVKNLIDIFSSRPGFTFIAQTHVMAIRPWVLDALAALGVQALEMGFESADTDMLAEGHKIAKGLQHYEEQLLQVSERDINVIVNVMGGLPWEREESHVSTVQWLRENPAGVWLANLYNYVPYPLSPSFSEIRDRIFNWDYKDWREDLPVVFEPYYVTRDQSWEMFQEKIAAARDMISAGRG